MRINQLFQSVFFALILVGIFASMAQNNYGFALMGWACFGLAFLYAAQLSWKIGADFSHLERKNLPVLMELFLLSGFPSVFGFRFFYIPIPAGEIIFVSLCCLLFFTYLSIALELFGLVKKDSPVIARRVLFLYASIILFILAMGVRLFDPRVSTAIGLLGGLLALPFMIGVIQSKPYDYSGKTITLFQFVVKSQHKAGLLFLFFVCSGIYMGLSDFGIVPKVANAQMPKTYIELINDAEAGKEKPVNGQYHHEKYKQAMDSFLERQGKKKAQ